LQTPPNGTIQGDAPVIFSVRLAAINLVFVKPGHKVSEYGWFFIWKSNEILRLIFGPGLEYAVEVFQFVAEHILVQDELGIIRTDVDSYHGAGNNHTLKEDVSILP
jgi:hypothetical protein